MKKTAATANENDIYEVLAGYGKSLASLGGLQERVNDLENSIKAFLDMQCMIGEETVNSFEIIIDRLNHIQQSLNKHPGEQAQAMLNNEVIPADPPEKCSYGFHATVDRKKFISLHHHLGQEECTGQGDVAGFRFPIHIEYTDGKFTLIQMPCSGVNQSIEELAAELAEVQIKTWDADSEDNLIALLASHIQQKTQYLGGLTRVLQKLSKKQLIERLQQNVAPFLYKQQDIYSGEAVMDYLLDNWPMQGKGYLYYSFAQQKAAAAPGESGIAIPVLLSRIERFAPRRKALQTIPQVNP